MATRDWIQIGLYVLVLLLAAKPLGVYMARVLDGERTIMARVLGWLERLIFKAGGVDPNESMGWKRYGANVLGFSVASTLLVFGLQRLQGVLPLNPSGLVAVSADSSLNTASSFVTNTNWQGYAGESTMSYLTQMLGLTVQNFASAAVGIGVLAALIRGLRSNGASGIGNFWADITRSTLYILLPLSIVFSLFFVIQGVVQTFDSSEKVQLTHSMTGADGEIVNEQIIARGPAASQVAIKQLGTNGGGFFNVNSAHPLESPTPASNFLQCLGILLIPAALCTTFGVMVGQRKQGWALLAAMLVLFLTFLIPTVIQEQQGNPTFASLSLTGSANWEGKEARFGIGNSALWATATTAASNGSVNSMHDSFTPLGGLFPMALMQLGEVVFGGVGSGLYGMLVFAIITVFIAGLMVGRTPEYLGKKIDVFEMKMASLVILIPCVVTLLCTAIALVWPSADAGVSQGAKGMANAGAHGFSELLYNYSSMANNNGSAFAGFSANVLFHNILGAVAMWLSRFWIIIPVLAIAGSLARKKVIPSGQGTLPTHTPLFVILLCSVVLIVGALTFIPALGLGPIVEHLQISR